MIRLVQRRLIIPQGDSGHFAIPALASGDNIIAVFSIFNNYTRIWTHEYPIENGMIKIRFEHEDTVNFPIGKYNWDIKIYTNPMHDENGLLIDGDEVDSYYAGFSLPECEITLAPIHGG